ncbi:hypothetical protein ACEPAG_4635 [Sanghuangporus baumii]
MSGPTLALSRRAFPLRAPATLRRLGCLESLHWSRSFSSTPLAARESDHLSSRLGPVGVEAALRSQADSSFKPHPTLFNKEFSLANRVAVVTGGQRGLGLEMAATLAEAGAAVYCLDLPTEPDKTFNATQSYVSKLGLSGGARLEYTSVDVTKQKAIWDAVEKIAQREGRLDVCIAAAGVIGSQPALEYTPEEFDKIMRVNVNGVYYTAQAAGRQMVKFGEPGSIILIASMGASVAFAKEHWSAYGTSKGAVKQMGSYLACELGSNQIRVNTISPGYIYTNMTRIYLDDYPHLIKEWGAQNPLGRIGRPDDLRGAVAWLASDASSFCTGSDILITGGHHAW